MKKICVLFVLLLISAVSFSQVVEELNLAIKIKMNSEILNEERTIYISTPPGYKSSEKTYPVFYVLTGTPTLTRYASGLVELLSQNDLCPEMIVVTIANGPKAFGDMTPTNSNINWEGQETDWGMELGKADRFMKYFESELFPYIEKNYRTQPFRVFWGHSAGGMCVMHAFLSHNHLFNGFIASSPSLWWDDHLFERTAKEKLSGMDLKSKHLYVCAGKNEDAFKIINNSNFKQILQEKAPKELRWTCLLLEGENHSSMKAATMHDGLRFIFDGWSQDYDRIHTEGMAYIDEVFKKRSEIYGYKITPREDDLTRVGYLMILGKKFDKAVEFLLRNTEDNPNSANAFDSLGDAYMAAGKIDEAMAAYEKAVKLAKENQDANLEVYLKNLDKAKAAK